MNRPRRPRAKRSKVYQYAPEFTHPALDKVAHYWGVWKVLSWQRKTATVSLVVLLFAILIPLLSYAYYARDISNKDRLINRKNTGVVLLDRNGEEFYHYNNGRSQEELTPLDEISDYAEQALVATEDKTFYEHEGFSFRSILAAAYANITGGDIKRYGGSTITQQLVKNSLFSNDKSFLRKYQELFLAIAVDRTFEKDEILEMYLNSVYFGEGSFGISSASETYFNKPASDLTLDESAVLIGLLPAPSKYSPVSGDRDKAKERQQLVLSSMVEEGNITQSEADQAYNSQLAIDFQEPQSENQAFHFALEVLDELEREYGEEEVFRSGYSVTTTLDLAKQREAEEAVKNQVASLAYADATNGAALAIDPKTGEVLVMVGSYDFSDKKFGTVNMTTTARQPGSSFKPIYYSEALAQELITPATFITDEPTTFGNGYEPENYDFRYRGDIRVRDALATSLNIPAVKVLEKLGVNEGVAAARRMGLETIEEENDYGLSLALGTAEVRLIDLTNAYASFAHGGQQFEPSMIKSIDDKFGKTIFESRTRAERVLDEDAAFLISSILSDQSARAPTFGSRFSIGKTMAVKTGTTQDSRDAWTVTYTPSLALGVWVGNNDNQPMRGVGGSSAAGPINVELMRSYLSDVDNEEFLQPSGVVPADVCPGEFSVASGVVPGAYTDYFIRGTLPTDRCYAPHEPEPEPEESPEPTPTEQEPEEPLPEPPTTEEPPTDTPPPDEEEPTDPSTDPGTTPSEGTNPPQQ